MAYKQPRVPTMKDGRLVEYIRELVLFLKDFCLETWMAVTKVQKQVENIPKDGVPQFSDALPKVSGTANAGKAETIARGDHVHPYPIRLVHSAGNSYTYLSKTAANRTHSLVTEEADGSGMSVALYVSTDKGVPTIRYQDELGDVTFHGLYSDARKPTADDVGALAKTGGVATGTVKAHTFVLGNANDYPSISFEADDETKGRVGAIQYSAPDNGRRFSFLHYPANQDGASSKKFESFQLPKPEADLAESKYYNIYTTKNPPTASQVGAVPTSRKINGKALSGDVTLVPADIGGFVGCQEVSVASESIAAGSTGTGSVTFAEISGASKYYAIPLSAGSIYGRLVSSSINGTTLTATYFNDSTGAHTVGNKFLIVGIK